MDQPIDIEGGSEDNNLERKQKAREAVKRLIASEATGEQPKPISDKPKHPMAKPCSDKPKHPEAKPRAAISDKPKRPVATPFASTTKKKVPKAQGPLKSHEGSRHQWLVRTGIQGKGSSKVFKYGPGPGHQYTDKSQAIPPLL